MVLIKAASESARMETNTTCEQDQTHQTLLKNVSVDIFTFDKNV